MPCRFLRRESDPPPQAPNRAKSSIKRFDNFVVWTAVSSGDNCPNQVVTHVGDASNGGSGCDGDVNIITRTYLVTDASGNTASCTQTINQEADPMTVALTPSVYACGYNISCNGASDGSISTAVTGGCVPYTYSRNNAGTTSGIGNLPAGTYDVTVTDAQGCTVSGSIILTEPDPLVIVSIVPKVYNCGYNISCNGYNDGEVDVTISGGASCEPYTVALSNAQTQSNTGSSPVNHSGLVAGTYDVVITDANGCTVGGGFVLTQPDPLVVSAGPNATVFFGYPDSACTLLQASGEAGGCAPYSYQWVDGNTNAVVSNTNSANVCPDTTTDYTLTITDDNGCTFSDVVRVCVIDVHCGNNGDKIFLCHVPPGNPENQNNICIALSGAIAHLAEVHGGDYLGPCNPSGAVDPCLDDAPAKMAGNTGGHGAAGAILEGEAVFDAFPNPFAATTILRFSVPTDDHVSILVYNMAGVEIMNLFEGDVTAGKSYEIEFSPTDVPGGIYFGRMFTTTGEAIVRKLVMQR